MDIPLLAVLLGATEGDLGILPGLRGWIAAVVGVPLMIAGIVMSFIFGAREGRPLYKGLAVACAIIAMLGLVLVVYRSCGQPCDHWVPVAGGGGYCSD